MLLSARIKNELFSRGAHFVRLVNISQFDDEQTQGYPFAILLGIYLSPGYLKKVYNNPCYVEEMKQPRPEISKEAHTSISEDAAYATNENHERIDSSENNLIEKDEFFLKERQTDRLADYIAAYLNEMGYDAYSQSEQNISDSGRFDLERKCTPLPHKTIARLAGMGWIGKNNLLVTPRYGSAISMCSVLTNAPLSPDIYDQPESLCGDCHICADICSPGAIQGTTWTQGICRDLMVTVDLCTTCLQCMVHCPWTRRYMTRAEE